MPTTLTAHFVLYVIAALCFLITALMTLAAWQLGKFTAMVWLALGLLAWVLVNLVP